MAEIHVEPKRRGRGGLIALLVLVVVLGFVAYYLFYYRNG